MTQLFAMGGSIRDDDGKEHFVLCRPAGGLPYVAEADEGYNMWRGCWHSTHLYTLDESGRSASLHQYSAECMMKVGYPNHVTLSDEDARDVARVVTEGRFWNSKGRRTWYEVAAAPTAGSATGEGDLHATDHGVAEPA